MTDEQRAERERINVEKMQSDITFRNHIDKKREADDLVGRREAAAHKASARRRRGLPE